MGISSLMRRVHHRLRRQVYLPIQELYYLKRQSKSTPGSPAWLIGTEVKYGGLQINVPRNKVSPNDPRTEAMLRTGGMTGGDRMLHHGYASIYSEYLREFVGRDQPLTIAEFGVLKGTGLAIWCDLFERARIMGFDIDLGHIDSNRANLEASGAFRKNKPELHEFDQLVENAAYLDRILNGDTIDICIDDGLHSPESILTTLQSVTPHLANKFVYFIEDNEAVHTQIRKNYPNLIVRHAGMMTVLTRN